MGKMNVVGMVRTKRIKDSGEIGVSFDSKQRILSDWKVKEEE